MTPAADITPLPAGPIRARHKTAPAISVVVPIKGHPVLIDDAIASVQREIEAGTIQRLIAVNDGCEYAETIDSLTAWQEVLGTRMKVLHCANAGLSAARNRGIAAALEADADLDAIFLLDADNILVAGAGAAMQSLMSRHEQADWFYPDFDFFGQNGHYVTDREYDLLFHAQINLCEAGSLIRRRIFDAGIRFDEGMKRGYEDWDFWLSAAQAGFRGKPAAQPLLLYRKRPVSMLSNSHNADGELRRYLETKHAWLFNTPKLLALEAARFPRFAVIEGQAAMARLLTDPTQRREVSIDELERQIMAHFAEPFANHAPQYIVLLREGVSARLTESRLLRSFFWNAERRWARANERPQFDLFYLESSAGGHHIANDCGNPERLADGVVIDLQAIRDLITGDDEDSLRRIDHAPSEFSIASWGLELEGMSPLELKTASGPELLRSFLLRLSRSRFRSALAQRWEWREQGGAIDRATSVSIPRRVNAGGIVFPLLKQPGQRDIGFVLPIFDFGGVEKVVASMAREFQQNGYRCHLFVVSDRPIHPDGWALQAFTSVNWMPDSSAIDWTGTEFLGTAEPSWGNDVEKADMIGLLSGMDVVVNAHSGALHKVADLLRRRGVTMIDHEHLLERSIYGRNYGPPKLALAYEYAYDLILTCSDALRRWMHAHGVPREKLMAVVNAPGYPLPHGARGLIERRGERAADKPLRVLFMGRLDPQKGVHRLSQIFHSLALQAPDIRLTIAGGSVVDREDVDFSFPRGTQMLGPVRGAEALTKLLLDTDIMVLPSHYEGLPLSILEAQRCGVVVIATDVGAMDEAIQHGTTGFILPEDGCEEAFARQIMLLDADRRLLAQVSRDADRMARDWSLAVAPLLVWLNRREGGPAAEEEGVEELDMYRSIL
ncbi:glycosyltransferase [Paracoccus laeviglucosivorans]|uniref:Glycosyltransferase involved in cell wall bisynthesis n=1 Tax=Paracoccus laeviglucosivorans TaxID=1197861 RepID=A0A521FNX2_9RHOB|nr:glycosyltransferase [Paracoccus laeviglucosivorans]SMO97826.1 Glycosyltransferase involved in cell wall bisynthesis [Paracoccus laeviglucosivorans]